MISPGSKWLNSLTNSSQNVSPIPPISIQKITFIFPQKRTLTNSHYIYFVKYNCIISQKTMLYISSCISINIIPWSSIAYGTQ
jgi:hypothetical protein